MSNQTVERLEHLKTLQGSYTRKMQELEKQEAMLGITTPPHIRIDLDDTRVNLARITAEIEVLSKETSRNQTGNESEILANMNQEKKSSNSQALQKGRGATIIGGWLVFLFVIVVIANASGAWTSLLEAFQGVISPRPPTPMSEATALATAQNARLVFGPSSDTVSNSPNTLTFHDAKVNLTNFVTEATFINPYSIDQGSWSYGLMFRRWQNQKQEFGYFYYYITSDGNWYLSGGHPENGSTYFTGKVDHLDLSAGGSNKLKIIVTDKAASIFINDEYIDTVDVSKNIELGSIAVATGFGSKGIAGTTTAYTITIRSLDK